MERTFSHYRASRSHDLSIRAGYVKGPTWTVVCSGKGYLTTMGLNGTIDDFLNSIMSSRVRTSGLDSRNKPFT